MKNQVIFFLLFCCLSGSIIAHEIPLTQVVRGLYSAEKGPIELLLKKHQYPYFLLLEQHCSYCLVQLRKMRSCFREAPIILVIAGQRKDLQKKFFSYKKDFQFFYFDSTNAQVTPTHYFFNKQYELIKKYSGVMECEKILRPFSS